MKRVVVIIATVVLGLMGVPSAPAQATPGWVKPSAPTTLSVTAGKAAGQVSLTWSSPASAGSRAVYGYTILRDGGGKRSFAWQKAQRDTTRPYARTFAVRSGVTTTFTVWAWTLAGRSPAATVTWTPATTPVGPRVYAVDATGTVVSVGGVTPTPVVTGADVSGLTADGSGRLYYADLTAKTIVRVATDGSRTVLASKIQASPIPFGVSATGVVTYGDGATLRRIGTDGRVSTAYTGTGAVKAVAVNPDGTAVAGFDADDSSFGFDTLVTLPATGAATTRTLDCSGFTACVDLDLAPGGQVFVQLNAGGYTGYTSWAALPAGAAVPVPLLDRTAFTAFGVGPDGTAYIPASATFCVPSRNPEVPDTCDTQPPAASIERFSADGQKRTPLPVSGATLAGPTVAVDAAGTLYLDSADGLVTVPATGGAASLLAAGAFGQPVVVG